MARRSFGFVGASLALIVFFGAAAAGAGLLPEAFGFNEGLTPLRGVAAPGQKAPRPQTCAECHPKAYEEWHRSRHRVAFSNPVFQEGFRREPTMRCIHCHAPHAEQAREVLAALPSGSFLERRRTLHRQPLRVSPEARAHDGVDCAACHVREGAVITTGDDVRADGHLPSPLAAKLGDPAFCGGCHQFQFHELEQGRLVLTGQLMQGTWDEWRAYAASGGEGTCQSCHMKRGSHEVLGTRHLDFLRGALSVEALHANGRSVLVLRSVGVGHHVPSGDVFRHLTVEVSADATSWREVAWIGRKYEPAKNEVTGRVQMVQVVDSALRPGERREVPLPDDARHWRLRYHYVSDEPHARERLSPEDVAVVIAAGEVGP